MPNDSAPLEIVAVSDAMQAVLAKVDRVASTRATVMIEGETGTGKEVVARAIHARGDRAARPFVAVNCAALSASLLESELFGHVRGAFTGANTAHDGLFVQANGGTLFLDEVNSLPKEAQAALLRVLQEKRVRPVGGSRDVAVDVRIVSATNANLEVEAKAGRFRADLMYRLRVYPIVIPPLRDRPADIPSLAQHFLGRFAAEYGKDIAGFKQATMLRLSAHHWPGNVRELENEIHRIVIDWQAAEVDITLLSPAVAQAGRPAAVPALARAAAEVTPIDAAASGAARRG